MTVLAEQRARGREAVTRRALYLGTRPDPSIAHMHEPANRARGSAVLIVPPFGWDDIASYRARREWADAPGGHGPPGAAPGSTGHRRQRRRSWRPGTSGGLDRGGRRGGSVAARRGTRSCRVTAIGLGLGGLIAWTATARGAAIDDLVLWATPAKGRALVRELRAVAALKADEWHGGSPPDDAITLMDAFDVAGYVISDETADALSALDLTKLALDDAGTRRLLLIGRDSVAADPALAEHATTIGVDLTQDGRPGLGHDDHRPAGVGTADGGRRLRRRLARGRSLSAAADGE